MITEGTWTGGLVQDLGYVGSDFTVQASDTGFSDSNYSGSGYTESELYAMIDSGTWSGGYVQDMGYVGPDTNVQPGLVISTASDSATIDNTDPFTLQQSLENPDAVASAVKNSYYEKYGVELDISDESLAAEIKWHARLYSSGYYEDHTDVTNAGETDKERAIWWFLGKIGAY